MLMGVEVEMVVDRVTWLICLFGAGWSSCGCVHVGFEGDKLSSQFGGNEGMKLLGGDWLGSLTKSQNQQVRCGFVRQHLAICQKPVIITAWQNQYKFQ